MASKRKDNSLKDYTFLCPLLSSSIFPPSPSSLFLIFSSPPYSWLYSTNIGIIHFTTSVIVSVSHKWYQPRNIMSVILLACVQMYGMIHLLCLQDIFDSLDLVILLTSCICHDIDHPGFNNRSD